MTSEVRENLVKEIREDALGKYGLPSKEDAVNKVIDEWEYNKAGLMQLFSKHPNWNPEKFQIAFDTTVDREVDERKVCRFFNDVYEKVRGKIEWTDTLQALRYYTSSTINNLIEGYAKEDYPDLRITKGQKTSKAVNKILKYLKVDEMMGTYVDREVTKKVYDRAFAAYSDAINPLQIVRHTVLSCHPVDYLLMSNGNSWSSCHTINKNDRDSGYSGMRCSGTVSYMLDGTSFVFYHVDESYSGDALELQPKIIRQMFHYENGVLVQGRLYPQTNDGKNSLYVPTRAVVQKVLADCLGLPNLWRKKGGTDVCNSYINSYGTHYRDYIYQSECNVSRIIDMIPEGNDERKVHIGHNPICFLCGREHSRESWLYCDSCGDHSGNKDEDGYYCEECGEWVDEDDVIWIDDSPYCRDCVEYCEECEEYEIRSRINYYSDVDRCICDSCFERYYTRCDCGHVCRNDDVTEDVHGTTYCNDCADSLVEVDDELYPEDEIKICPACGCVHVEEGDYCIDCAEEAENERG